MTRGAPGSTLSGRVEESHENPTLVTLFGGPGGVSSESSARMASPDIVAEEGGALFRFVIAHADGHTNGVAARRRDGSEFVAEFTV
ncbi:MAG: hypothetical protein ACI9E1_000812 [Cryomorphaceae bacterium]|jgi:hypothetical protein